jgi:hypothetical protein
MASEQGVTSEPNAAAERLFCPPVIPEPPSKYAEARLEWREGYVQGWQVGPGREAPSLYDKAAPVRKKQWGATALGGLRGAAWKAGKEAARDAKRTIIAGLWPIAQERGRPHTQPVNNYPRDGTAYQGVFFFYFGTGKMPIVEPVDDAP